MDVLLTRPPTKTLPFLYEDLGLETVAGALRASGIRCRIDDGVLRPSPIQAYLERLAAAPEPIVGLTVHSELVADRVLAIAGLLKRACPDKIVLIGGHPVAAIDEEIALKYPGSFDVLVRGEGAGPAVDVCTRLSEDGLRGLDGIPGITYRHDGATRRNPARPPGPRSLDEPFPARDAWADPACRPGSGSALVSSSQGCDHRCTFCTVGAFHGGRSGWRGRPLDAFVAELSLLRSRHGVSDATIVDPNFLGPLAGRDRRVADFCRALRDARLGFTFEIAARADALDPATVSRLRQAGLRRVLVGVESGVDSLLRAWHKGVSSDGCERTLRELYEQRIYVELGFVMLHPACTLEEVRENLSFLRRLPYFNTYNLAQALWPFHLGAGAFNVETALLEEHPERIYRSYRFRDRRVWQYARACSLMTLGLGRPFTDVRQAAWKRLSSDDDTLPRYRETQLAMLEPYMSALERGLELIERGIADEALDAAILDEVEAVRGRVEALALGFVRSRPGPGRRGQ